MRSTQGLLFGILLAVSTPSDARDWYISPQGANGHEMGGGWVTPANLRYALDNISQGDTLRMSPGVYEVSQSFATDKSFAIVAGGENVKIQSLGNDRVFVFNGGVGQSVLLRGIEIRGGNAALSTVKPNCGGAIYVAPSVVVTLDNVTLSENKAATTTDDAVKGYGGAIYNEGVLNLTGNTLFQKDTASLRTMGYGGAIYNNGGTVRISGSTAFRNNVASGGGEGNCAFGGALYHTGQGASLKIEGSAQGEWVAGNGPSFVGNIAALHTGALRAGGAFYAYGGAIFVGEGTVLEINRVYMQGNIAFYGSGDGYGGAIYVSANTSASIENVILSGNIAVTGGGVIGGGYGGAIWNAGACRLRNIQLIENIASAESWRGHGGGIYNTYVTGDRSKNGKLYFEGENVFKGNIALSNSFTLRDNSGEGFPTAFGGAIAIINTLPEGGSATVPDVSITTDTDDNDPTFSLLFDGNIAGKAIAGDAGGGAIGILGANVIVGDDINDQNIIFKNNVALDSPESQNGGYGGAIMVINSPATMYALQCYGADFKGNIATMSLTGEGKGGAIASTRGASVHVIRGSFEENYANGNPASTGKAWGGAYAAFRTGDGAGSSQFIAAGESMLLGNDGADGVSFRNNAATKGTGQGFGGAASVTDGGFLRFSDRSLLEGNEASASSSEEGGLGGGVYLSNEDNPASQGQLQLREAIIRKNRASVGGGIWVGNIEWLQFNEYDHHKQQSWIMNNEAPIGPNIYPTDGVCSVEIRKVQASAEISCIPDYNTYYAVMKGNQFKFTLTVPKGHQAAVIKINSKGQASAPNPVSTGGTVSNYSVTVDADAVTIWCTSSVAIRKPLTVVTKSGLKVVILKPGEKDTLEYLLNPFIPASTFDPLAIQWKTTDYGIVEGKSIGVNSWGEITAKEEGFAYITVGLKPDYTPNVFPAGAFSGNFSERDTVGVYVIDSNFDGALDSTLGHIHYKDSSWLPVRLPEEWSVLEDNAITWRLDGDQTVAELNQHTNTSGHIRFLKTGQTKLIFELKMRSGYNISYDLYVIDSLKLTGLEKEIFNVGTEIPCVLSETGLPQKYRELGWKLSDPTIAHVGNVMDNLVYLQMEAFGRTTLTVYLKEDTTKYVSAEFSVVRLVLNFPEVVLTNEWTTGTAQFIPDTVLPVEWVKPKNDTNSEIHSNLNKAAIRFLKPGQDNIVSIEVKGTDVKDSIRVTVIDTSYIVFVLPGNDTIVPSGGTMPVPSNVNKTLRLSVRPEIPDVYYTWSSDNKAVAQIGQVDGLLTTVSRGSATISATCSRNPNLVIKQRIFVKDVSISDSILFLPLRDSFFFSLPEDIDPGTVLWETTDPNIVRIDHGKIKVGDIPGVAVVSAKPLLNNADEIPLSSIQRTVYAVKLALEDKEMPVGTSAYFQVQAQPSGVVTHATDLNWVSSSPAALEINEQGYAHVISATAEPISVTASLKANPKVKVSAVVKVNPVRSIAIKSPSYGDPSFEYEVGGKLYKFSVVFTPADASDTIVTWETLTPDIFSIEEEADTWVTIKVLKAGTAQIRAVTANGCTDTYSFTAVPSDIQVSLNKTVLSLRKGETYVLSASARSEVEMNPVYTFVSENSQIATVDSHTGLIEAKEYGDTYVTVRFVYGLKTYKADCHVKVENALDSIGIKAGTLSVKNGDTLLIDKYGGDKQLQITFYPSDATNKTLRYQSSQPLVATVTSLGWVRPLSDGHTNIIVQAAGTSDTLKTFVVKVQTPLQNIRLNSHNLTLGKGRTYPLRVFFEPEDISVHPSLQWTSNNPSIVSVDNAGWLELKSEGKTFIRVATVDARFSDTCWISVVTFPESLTLNKRRLELNTGMSAILTPILLPQGVTNKGVQWKIDNAEVAIVQSDNGDGRITAQGVGTATVTAITEDGTLSASCVVTVESLVNGVNLSHNSLSLQKEESRLLRAEVTPLDAYRMRIEWSSDNENVVEVTTSGKITAKGGGTARITAKTENGFEATCQISVSVPVLSMQLTPPLLVVYSGQEFAFTATFFPEDASAENVTWMVDNPSILEIRSLDNRKVCYFLAKKPGWVLIQATSSDHKAICQTSLLVKDIFGLENLPPALETVKPTVTYNSGVLRVVDLEGFQVYVTTIHGKTCGAFRIIKTDEDIPLNLPTGIYILNARNGKEQFTLKFIVR
ncbi:MAG: Ig-like domain-containing protein [Tannerellaceae bacterium]|jgi:uncharacterized protein YjdB|nr:Ig-like domain-containing protein [Tannerellaceae bacterium]